MSSKSVRYALFVLGGLSALIAQALARNSNGSPLTAASLPESNAQKQDQIQPITTHLMTLTHAVAPPEWLSSLPASLSPQQKAQQNLLQIAHALDQAERDHAKRLTKPLSPLPELFPELPPLLPELSGHSATPDPQAIDAVVNAIVAATLRQAVPQPDAIAPSSPNSRSAPKNQPSPQTAQQAASLQQAPVALEPMVVKPVSSQSGPSQSGFSQSDSRQPLPQESVTQKPVPQEPVAPLASASLLPEQPDPKAPVSKAPATVNSTAASVAAKLPTEPSVTDIATHPSQTAIAALLQRQIIQGFPDGTFRPDARITDEEFTLMLERAFRRNDTTVAMIQRPPNVVTRAQAAELIYQQLQRSEIIMRAHTRTLIASRTPTGGAVALPETVAITADGMNAFAGGALPTATVTTPMPPRVLAAQSNRPQTLRPVRVAIAGAISRPGSYLLVPTAGNQFPTVTQLIRQAGGMHQTANPSLIQIRRSQDNGTETTMTVNLWELFKAGDRQQDPVLQHGDLVFVPPAAANSPAIAQQLAAAHFARLNQPITVTVLGQVSRPGDYTLDLTGNRVGDTNTTDSSDKTIGNAWLTITEAIRRAGGITPRADLRQIQVKRTSRSGPPQVININLGNLGQTGDLGRDIVLQQGDTITIPEISVLAPTNVVRQEAFSP